MAQSKLNDLASKLGKGGAPKGLGTGLKLLGVAAALGYGVSQSVFTGKQQTKGPLYIY
jgi:prohibitin 2